MPVIRVRTFRQPCSAIKHSVTLNHTRSQAQRPQGGYLTTSALEKKKKKKEREKLQGCAVHLKRFNHDVSCHNNSVILTCNLMFSLARRLIEKRVVDVDAVPFLFFWGFFLLLYWPCSRPATASVGFGVGKWGITLRFHLATLWRFEVYSQRERKVTNVLVIDSES